MPNGAAWFGSPVPGACALSRANSSSSVFTSDLLAFPYFRSGLAGPLRPAVGFPDLRDGSSHPRLLRGPRPARRPQRTTRLPVPALAARDEGDAGRFPRSPHDRSARVGVQLCPSGIATTTPWTFTVASRREGIHPARSSRPATARPVRTATQPISARFELVGRLRGFTHWFLTYAFPPCLPNPHRLAVPARPGVVRAASHPPRRFPDQAALSFTGLPRQPDGGGLSPPPGDAAPRGARCRRPRGRRSPHRTDREPRTCAARSSRSRSTC